MGLFDVVHENHDGKDVVKVVLAGGYEKPYYIKRQGMSEKGCFIRVGSATEPMSVRMIEELFSRRTRNNLGKMESPRKDLKFEQLKIYYQEAGYALNDNFLNSLELKTPESEMNYAAYLVADENGVSFKVAKYEGKTRVDLIENNEYGYCSIMKAVDRVLEKLEIENKTLTKITPRKRLEKRLLDPTALREAVINAIIHNDYSNGAPPKFELFSDRLEITSMGGLPYGMNEEDFFAGISAPRSKELMRIFRDLDIVENLGSGVPRILEKYERSNFLIKPNYVRIIFPFHVDSLTEQSSGKMSAKNVGKAKMSGKSVGKVTEKNEKVLNLIESNPKITIPEIAESLGVSSRTIERSVGKLQTENRLKRIGGRKEGYWKVIKE